MEGGGRQKIGVVLTVDIGRHWLTRLAYLHGRHLKVNVCDADNLKFPGGRQTIKVKWATVQTFRFFENYRQTLADNWENVSNGRQFGRNYEELSLFDLSVLFILEIWFLPASVW